MNEHLSYNKHCRVTLFMHRRTLTYSTTSKIISRTDLSEHAHKQASNSLLNNDGLSDIDIKTLSKSIILKLMQKEEFQNLWLQQCVINLGNNKTTIFTDRKKEQQQQQRSRVLNNDRTTFIQSNINVADTLRSDNSSNAHFSSCSCSLLSPQPYLLPTYLCSHSTAPAIKADSSLGISLKKLSNGLHLAIETYLRGTKMAYFSQQMRSVECFENNRHGIISWMKRMTVSFYSVQVQLQRFCESGRLNRAKFELVARQLNNLLRIFTSHMSIPYSIENCAFLASNLYNMHIQFFHYISHFELTKNCTEYRLFYAKIKQFQKMVIQHVEELLLLYMTKGANVFHQTRHVNFMDALARNSRIMLLSRNPSQSVQRHKSFLLPQELEYEREKMRKIAGNK